MKKSILGAGALSLLVLAGCAQPVPVNPQVSALMPAAVARQVLLKTFNKDWLEQPVLMRTELCSRPFSRVPIAFTDIRAMKYHPAIGRVFIYRDPPAILTCMEYVQVPVGPQGVEEVFTALRALGACTAPGSQC